MKILSNTIIFLLLSILIFSYTTDSVIIDNVNKSGIINFNLNYSTSTSSQIWEDDFLDESKIDLQLSYNYEINKSQGIIFIKDTYEAWYNPDFTRMKTIDIYNNGDQTFYDYVIDLIIYYDTDMQTDFEDLRFTDKLGNNLHYWIGETISGEQTNALVRINEIPPGHTDIYMFYGNPSAQDNSDFDMIFVWDDRTDPDIMISYKNYLEGAWDSDVEFGDNRFLVAWEERLGPEDLPENLERSIFSSINGRTYNSEGGDPDPNGDDDIDITPSDSTDYHAQNPSIAYGGINKNFFVVWEENPATIFERFEVDIKASLVKSAGDVIKSSKLIQVLHMIVTVTDFS
jgi:hypothetical protein